MIYHTYDRDAGDEQPQPEPQPDYSARERVKQQLVQRGPIHYVLETAEQARVRKVSDRMLEQVFGAGD